MAFVVDMLDEILQIQMVCCIESLPQVLGHEAIEISPCHFPADVHAAALVAKEIAQGNSLLGDVVAIVNTGIRARPKDAGDAFLVPQKGMAGRHQVVGHLDLGLGEMVLEDFLDNLAILFDTTTCAVIMDGL